MRSEVKVLRTPELERFSAEAGVSFLRAVSLCGFDIILTSVYMCIYVLLCRLSKILKALNLLILSAFSRLFTMAEKERFELSNRVTGYTISNRAPSTN